MNALQTLISELGITGTIATALIVGLAVMQVLVEIITLKSKIKIPDWLRISTIFRRKQAKEDERLQTLKDVQKLLQEVNTHYNADNIKKRDDWMTQVNDNMTFVNERAKVYDDSIKKIVNSLDANTKMTEDMFVEFSRDRIMSFAEKAADDDYLLSREQFARIERIYNEYEDFLKARNRENGEVDVAWEVIQEGRKHRIVHHCFTEDIKKLPTKKDQ